MRRAEGQTLSILAIIAVGIIVLCTWGGGQPTLEDMDREFTNAEAAGLNHEQDHIETGQSLVITPAPDPLANNSLSEQETTQDIINRWIDNMRENGNHMVRRLHTLPDDAGGTSEVTDPPVPPVVATTTHVVVRGETLSGISQKHFDTVTKWKRILEANKDILSAPEALRPGMKLVIPSATGSVTTPTTTPPTATLVAVADTPSRTYTVKRGDTLYGIAKRFYNSGSQHKKLLRANRDQLRAAKDLRPDMVLVIPQ